MKLFKSIIAGFLAIAITTSLTIPAFAVDPGTIVGALQVAPDFGSWLWDTAKTGGNLLAGFIDNDNYCPGAETSLNGRHDFAPQHTQINGKTGMFYICQNCGKSAGEVLAPAYNDYVETLPATGYTSTGGLLWQPTWKNVYSFSVSSLSSNILELYPFDLSSTTFSFSDRLTFFPDFKVSLVSFPYYGAYRVYVPFTASYRYQGTKGIVVSKQLFSRVSSETTRLTPSSSFAILISTTNQYPDWASKTYTSFNFVLPIFEVIPDTVIDKDTTYNINTRPTSITGGNYGIVGDNGQITKVEDNSTIINETNNTFYNPATGTTVPIVNWSYDYSDRSYRVDYNATNTTGDTVTNTSTITYGDEYITIQEIDNSKGDTITNNYTIYYLIDGSGSENPPSTCVHDWQETNTTPATCTIPGSKLSTCSKCQQTKKDSLPALGHDWQVKQTVTTEYDDTGQLIQEGYTIYECSRCKEQYKVASGTSPPVNPSDPDASGDGVFSGIFGLLLDFLGFFFKTFKDFTKSGVQAFLKALQDGTSDIFGLLNPFDWSA